jgi:hypothetical protein
VHPCAENLGHFGLSGCAFHQPRRTDYATGIASWVHGTMPRASSTVRRTRGRSRFRSRSAATVRTSYAAAWRRAERRPRRVSLAGLECVEAFFDGAPTPVNRYVTLPAGPGLGFTPKSGSLDLAADQATRRPLIARSAARWRRRGARKTDAASERLEIASHLVLAKTPLSK